MIQKENNSLLFKWNQTPFELSKSIKWRDLTFHFQIRAFDIHNGRTSLVTILYNNKSYNIGFTKWKWTGGSHGDNPPYIYNGAYYVRIQVYLDSLVFTEVNTKNEKNLEPGEGCNFELFDTPNSILFNNSLENQTSAPIEENNSSKQLTDPLIEKIICEIMESRGVDREKAERILANPW